MTDKEELNTCERCGKKIRSGLVLDKETGEKTCLKCMMDAKFEYMGTLGSDTAEGETRAVIGNLRTS